MGSWEELLDLVLPHYISAVSREVFANDVNYSKINVLSVNLDKRFRFEMR